MTNEPREQAPSYVCVSCGRQAVGRYIAGGWWQHPFGWLVHDDGTRFVCGLPCAQRESGPPEAPPSGLTVTSG